jgi:hypothetical protein
MFRFGREIAEPIGIFHQNTTLPKHVVFKL